MRQTTAASIVALGSFVLPAHAQQTIIYNDPAFQPQGQVFQPQQPFGNQPIFIDPNTGQPIVQQPIFGQPVPQQQPAQQGFGQQQAPQFQPQQGQTFGLPQPQPQPGFGDAVPQQQPNFGAPLPQPQQTYNPSQLPAIATAPQVPAQPQTPAQPQNNVPYYDRTTPNVAPAPAPVDQAITVPTTSDTPQEQTPAVIPAAQAPVQSSDTAISFGVPGSDRAPTMAAELDELLRVGERYRAASPGFLEDLKSLARKYREPLPQPPAQTAVDSFAPDISGTDNTDVALTEQDPALDPTAVLSPDPQSIDLAPTAPTGEVVTVVPPLDPGSTSFAYVEDDFTDGDLENNPPWRVRQGDWSIDPKYGLRAKAPQQTSDAPIRPKELLKVLLTGDAPDSSASSGPQAALIETQTSIGNAFSFAARIVDHAGTGTAHFIMHQGGANWLGYRLEIRSGPQPVVVLTRRGSNGYKDITKVAVPSFTTGEQHELRWARLSDGQMLVILNGRPIITSRDTVFREDWKGFAFFNAGGDVSIRAIRVSAPVER